MKHLKKFYWWLWYQIYSRRATWGVQWYWQGEAARWRMNACIKDKVFFRREAAERYWRNIKDVVRPDQVAALWEIDRADYKKVVDSVNYN